MRRIFDRATALYEKDNTSPVRFIDYGWPVMNKAFLGLDQGVVLFTAPPNVGKCLAEGTLLTMPDGTLRPIESIGDEEVVSLDIETLRTVHARALGAIYNGEKECFRVRTSLGHEIVATENHPFFTLDGWMELNDLNVGSRVAVARYTPKEAARHIRRVSDGMALPDAISTIRTSARNGTRAFHRDRIRQIGEHLDDDYLRNLGSSDVVWDRVVSIEHVGARPVYDIEVPATHNFVANNFVVHNSTLLMNMYVQIITNNPNVFVLDFSLDDCFEDRLRGTVARFAKIPINWVKLPANAPDAARLARDAGYNTWTEHIAPRLEIIDETDFDGKAKYLSVIRKTVRDVAEKLSEEKKLVVVVDGFHNIFVDDLRGADKNEKQAHLSAEMKTLASTTKSIIFATAHSPKGSMRRGLTQDAVKGAGEPTYDARVIANLYSDFKVHRGLAQVYHDVYLPHEPDIRVRQPVVELDIVKNKASGFCDIAFYKFIPEYALLHEAAEGEQTIWRDAITGGASR